MKQVVFCLFVLIVGCSTFPERVPQKLDVDKAVVNIESSRLYDQGTRFYSRNVNIKVYSAKGFCPWSSSDNLRDSYLFTTHLSYEAPKVVFDIPTDGDIYMHVTDYYAGTTCGQVIKLEPAKDAEYFVNLNLHTNAWVHCGAKISKWQDEELVRNYKFRIIKQDSFLSALFQYFNPHNICDDN